MASYPQSKYPDSSASFPTAIPTPFFRKENNILVEEPVAVLVFDENASVTVKIKLYALDSAAKIYEPPETVYLPE